ncbi:MAG: T9SS type A sorting domain-containing protein [Bacteroidota bacterium]
MLSRFAALLFSAYALVPPAVAQTDDFRPLVLLGVDTPVLLGSDVTAPVCHSWTGSDWTQCPLQIDERALLDRGLAYPFDLYPEFHEVDEIYHYTAPQDYPNPRITPYVPVDPDPALDEDDEIVLMARFFGLQADLAASPPPFSSENIQEVEFEGGYVYLYLPALPLDQSAGYDLVDYDFNLLAGDFPDDYDFSGNHYDQFHAEPNNHNLGDFLAANPEYSPIETAYYRTTFEDRWIQREMQFADAGGTMGPDILDRIKYASRPDYTGSRFGCGRTIWTGSAERGTLGIQKDGPLRALRYAQGYNSGGYNHVLYRMYEKYMVFEMAHTMHQTPGASMWYDLGEEAVGMTYYSNLFPAGVTVDGEPDYATDPEDDIFTTDYLEWDYLIGTQGSMVGVWESDNNLPEPLPFSYYEDDRTPSIQNCSGDGQAIGNFGNMYFEQKPASEEVTMRSTDPREAEAYFLDGTLRFMKLIRRAVPAVPNLSLAEAETVRDRLLTPIEFATTTLVVPGNDNTPPQIEGAVERAAQTYLGTASDIGAGIASLVLDRDAVNLSLASDFFAPGASEVTFTLMPIDRSMAASGTVVIADGRGNESTLFVQIDVPQEDMLAPRVTQTAERFFVEGEIAEDRLDDAGLASVELNDAVNLALDLEAFEVGETAPVAYRVRLLDVAQPGSGTLRVDDLNGLRTDEVFDLAPPPTDDQAPLVTADLEGTRLEGSVTELATNDLGLVSVVIDAPTNVTVDLGDVALGDTEVTFVVASINTEQPGSATLTAIDVTGNEQTYVLDIPPSLFDMELRAEAPQFESETEGSIRLWVGNVGTERFTLSRVQTISEMDADVTPNRIEVGALAPGDSVAVTFDFVTTSTNAEVRFKALDQFIGGAEVDNDNNVVDVPLVASTSGLLLVGSVQNGTFTGTVRATAAGLTSVQLSEDATNLSLTVSDFAPGTQESVSFLVARVASDQDGSGEVIATDQAGVVERIAIDLLAPAPDTRKPELAGSGTEGAFTGTASDDEQNDTGLASVALQGSATNAVLNVDAFDDGQETVGFVVTLVDPTRDGLATIAATDVAGNTGTLEVALLPAPTPEFDIVSKAAYVFDTEDAGLIAVTVRNNGLQPMSSVRVRVRSVDNVTLSTDAITIGEVVPGDAKTALFDFSGVGADARVFFQAQDLIVRRDESDLDNNEVTVRLTAEGADTTAPILSGDLDAEAEVLTFEGDARDDAPGDAGIASVALGDDAENVRLALAAFAPGDAAASFSVTLEDPSRSGSATVIATDLFGNQASLPVALATVTNEDSNGPSDGALAAEVFPTPFSRASTLRFHLDQARPVTVTVFDLTGRRRALLQEGTLAAGWHELRVDASGWPSGLYLYRIETDVRAETGRMTLLR